MQADVKQYRAKKGSPEPASQSTYDYCGQLNVQADNLVDGMLLGLLWRALFDLDGKTKKRLALACWLAENIDNPPNTPEFRDLLKLAEEERRPSTPKVS